MDINDAISIYCENIEEFSRRERLALIQRRGMVAELSEALVNGYPDLEAGEILRELKRRLPASEPEDRAMLCAALGVSARHSAQMKKNSFFGDEIAAGSHGKVSIVRNSYNEAAYSRVSALITRPKEILTASFTAACEDVYDGRSEFCILPIESSQSGRLFGFYSMLDRYELKICAVCELDTEGADESVKYALVGRTHPERIPRNSRWGFEFSVISENGGVFADILKVSEIFGGRLVKVDSLPVEYDRGLQKYYFTLEIPEANIPAFDLFLTEEYTRYTVQGIYPAV